jgi:predicted permease
MLARGAARRYEMAVRLALGASRARLMRQLLVESAVIAAAGAAIALTFAAWAGRALIGQLSTFMMPIDLRVAVDWPMLGFTAATMVAITFLFGIVPAYRAAEVPPASVIQASDRERGMGPREGRLSSGLIVLQITVSLTVIVMASLLVRSFSRLATAPLGFDRDASIVVTVNSPTVPAADRNAVYRRLVAAVSALPGVAAAGGSMNPPIAGMLIGNFVVSEPGMPPSPDALPFSQSDQITPGFLSAYRLTLKAGRDFDDRDAATGELTMIVNDAFVRRFLPGDDAVDRAVELTYRMPSQGDYRLGTMHIVGVVGDSVFRSIRDGNRPTIYLPLARNTGPILQSDFFVAVRAVAGPPRLLTRAVSDAMLAINRDLTLTIRTVGEQIDAALAQDRLVALLAAFFGALAVALAGIGLYGTTAYSVARRRREIGIRLALGARPGWIVRMILARVVGMILVGLAAGGAVALAATQVVASLLYGIDARDPSTFGLTAAILAMMGIVAAFVPAVRAARLDPVETLRES